MTAEPKVTLVIVPRERFGSSLASLENIYANTTVPFRLIYVDGNSPQPTAGQLAGEAKRRGFELIRKNTFLVPNYARNLGLAKVQTKYVVFMDNDIFVTPGWLERMTACAEETNADVVSPTYLEGKLERRIVHMANAISRIDKRSGKNYYTEERLHAGQVLDDIQGNLTRTTSELFEFHCVLMRTDLFVIPDLMPNDVSNLEHSHLSMRILELGRTIIYEPTSVVTYDYSFPFFIHDLPFFHYRWGQSVSMKSLNFFKQYWFLADDDPFVPNAEQWVKDHRRVPRLAMNSLKHVLGAPGFSILERAFLKFYRDYANFVNTKEFYRSLN